MTTYAFEPVDDYVEEALALLIQQYRGKPRMESLLSSYVRQCQEIEDVFWEIARQRNIDTATGIHLDVLGRTVGQRRIGPDDEVYRLHLRARIRINNSRGKTGDIIDVARLLTQTTNLALEEYFPASFVVDVFDPLSVDPEFTESLIHEATGAGIGTHLHYSLDEEDETFAFAEGDVEQDDEDRGFSDTDDTAPGGVLIDVA